jgi:putative membrane protein insertion efficiency factor
MVFIWGSGWGPRRRRRGYGPGFGGPGYGRGYGGGYGGGYGPRYGRGYGGGGGGSCLRDLLLLNVGCCAAESLGCGGDAFLLAPSTARAWRSAGKGEAGSGERTTMAARMIAAVRVYQREISPKRPPCCRYAPTCSNYAVEALERHGARRGAWLTVRRLVRCRPGAVGGSDPVPA